MLQILLHAFIQYVSVRLDHFCLFAQLCISILLSRITFWPVLQRERKKTCLFTSASLTALCFSLANGEVHVDSYGFRHVFEDTSNGLLLHYLCQELTLHYLMQAGSYEEHQRKWTHFMRLHGKSMANHVWSNCLFFF